ncbi:hypothetical protein AB0D12_34660 [Streptomyces sp. NPDC048479]|uniref:hypothetical protein n=1 Tax=Streptomyces sp. NPDC048479 TaxID=3154725 RepID=UPI00343CB77D
MRTRKPLPALLSSALATGGLSLLAIPAQAATVTDVTTAAQLKSALGLTNIPVTP